MGPCVFLNITRSMGSFSLTGHASGGGRSREAKIQSNSGSSPMIDAIRMISIHTGGLLSHCNTGASQFGRKILQLRQAILHRHHRLGIVDVDARRELQRRDGRRVDVDKAERRMVGHEVTAAALAVLAMALFS